MTSFFLSSKKKIEDQLWMLANNGRFHVLYAYNVSQAHWFYMYGHNLPCILFFYFPYKKL